MSQPPVSIHPYFKVHAGQMDAAKALLPIFVEQTSRETGRIVYEFTVNGDVVFCRESYRDGEAALAHLENVGETLGKMLKVSDLVRLEIHGPTDELAKMRGPMVALNPDWFEFAAGIAD